MSSVLMNSFTTTLFLINALFVAAMTYWIWTAQLQLLQVVLICSFCLTEVIVVHIFVLM